MPIKFDETGPKITAEVVEEFEATLPGPLPEEYRAFLLTYNGGRPEGNWWPPEVNGGDFGMHGFLGLGPVDENYSMVGHRETFRDQMPDRMLIIGYDSFDNQLCLSPAGDDRASCTSSTTNSNSTPSTPRTPTC